MLMVASPLVSTLSRRQTIPLAASLVVLGWWSAAQGQPVADAGAAGSVAPAVAGAADVIATVGDKPILRGDLVRVLERAGGAGGNPDPEKRQQLEAAAIEQLVDERLLRGEIARARIPIADAEIDDGVRRLRGQVESRGQEWPAFLARSGLDDDAVRGHIALEIGLDKLVRSQLREDRVAAAFARHRRKVDGTRLRVSHILLRPDIARGDEAVKESMARADEIRAEVLQAVVPFAEAARRHSAGPSRTQGGDLGWITRQSPFVEEFSRQAYELAKGDISRPFVTPFGVHLVQVTEVEPGQLGVNEVRAELLRLLAVDVLREIVVQARADTPIRYAEGVVHFDPETPANGRLPRRIVVAGGVVADAADR
jgi:parvulin-like peptidyl-prolyl isomerase